MHSLLNKMAAQVYCTENKIKADLTARNKAMSAYWGGGGLKIRQTRD